MAGDTVAEAGKMALSALFGGLITASLALPYFKNELTKLTVEVQNMKEACTTCRSGVNTHVKKLEDSIEEHHTDSDKHVTKAAEKLLQDIYDRVLRIESRIFNGQRQG